MRILLPKKRKTLQPKRDVWFRKDTVRKSKIGAFFAEARQRKGMTLHEAGKILGISHSALSQLETGRTEKCSIALVCRMRKLYELKWDAIELAVLSDN